MRALCLQPFYTPNLFAVSVSIGALVCDDADCGKVHGFAFTLQVAWWGLELEIQI